MPSTQALVNDFISKLGRRKIEGSDVTARLTVALLRVVIVQHKELPTNGARALIEAVKSVWEQLIAADPNELAVGNIVRRVLHIIREEDCSVLMHSVGELKLSADTEVEDTVEETNNQSLLSASIASGCLLQPPLLRGFLDRSPDLAPVYQTPASVDSFEGKGKSAHKSAKQLKSDVIKGVNELIEDIDTCHEQIAEQAVELIHQNEVVLTFGYSKFVMEFLCAAKEKKRSFDVFIAEGAPKFEGHVLAKELAKRGLKTTVITDSAVFAMISRVNMVVVGVRAVMANGGVIASVGMNMVALAARKYAVPFVVVAGTHELCPLHPQNPEVLLNEMRSPSELLDLEQFSDVMDYGVGSGSPRLHVVNPEFDYVPPELVSIFITNIGGYSPSYIFRLIADYYSSDDLTLQHKSAS